MIRHIALPLFITAFGFSGAGTASAQALRVGTVDMKRVFESYYKTKDAEGRINEARTGAKKELDDRMEVLNKGMADIKKVNDEIENPAISKETREQKSRQRDEKIAEIETLKREVQEFRTTREKQLHDQSGRLRGTIVEEINKVVGDLVKARNYDLVLDKSGPSLNAVPVVLFARDDYEFTNEVITELNKSRPKENGAAAKPNSAEPATANPTRAKPTPAKARKP
ncbi:MAG: OmpH family outer membrane protein [Verrucomicrobiota bacterium]|nr:OmpH family outer membrane protein [Verrucomicrobiota bacterium]